MRWDFRNYKMSRAVISQKIHLKRVLNYQAGHCKGSAESFSHAHTHTHHTLTLLVNVERIFKNISGSLDLFHFAEDTGI